MENAAVSANFEPAEIWAFLRARTECRQGAQRLWKSLHRDDAKPVRVGTGLARVLPSRDEEGIHTRLARSDRFLLNSTNREDGAVRADLAGSRHPVPVQHVAPE